MIARFAAAVAAAVGLSAAVPASAACSLKTQPIPVKMRGLAPIVTAKINGLGADFELDSGAASNMLNGKLAAGLGLRPLGIGQTGTHLPVAADTVREGAAGIDVVNGVVVVPKFEFQGAAFKDVPFIASARLTWVDGLLGQPFLKGTDVEYDLASGVVRLVKPQGCGKVNLAYWAKDGQTYSVVPLDWIDRDRPMTEAAIYVNGVRLRAVFDTGAGASMITEAAAGRAGVATGSPGVVSIGEGQGLDGSLKSWVGTFSSVKIGDEEIRNTPLIIGRSDAVWDVLLGADFFLSHHVYVANSRGEIYFTYSGGPVFRAPRPEAVAPAPK